MADGHRTLFSPLRSLRPQTVQEFFSDPPTLETPRLLLRRVTMRDVPDMYAYSRDPEVARHVLWQAHRSMLDTRAYVRYMIRQYHDGTPSSYGIVLKETGRLIGTIGFMAYSQDNNSAEVGYSLARAQWNKGLATEALRAVLGLAFEDMRLYRVEAMHECDNPASGRVMQKCGMRREGTLRGRVYNKGRYSDVEIYGILKTDWHGR